MALTSSHRRRTAGFTALFAALLLVLTGLFFVSPAAAVLDEHCPDHNGHPNKTEGSTAEADGDVVLPAGTSFCIKKQNSASGILTADGVKTLYDYLVEVGIDGAEDEGPSYYIVYEPEQEQLCPAGSDYEGTPISEVGGIENCNDIDIQVVKLWFDVNGDPTEAAEQALAVTVDVDGADDVILDQDDLDPSEVVSIPGDATVTSVTETTVPAGYVQIDCPDRQIFGPTSQERVPVTQTYFICNQEQEEVTTAPAAEITIGCDADNQIVLDNTGSDVAVTYTITGAEGYDTVEVPAGGEQTLPLTIAEDADYDITVSADDMDDINVSGTYNCEGVEGSEADPAASVIVDCDADNQIVLDNTGSDVAVVYTITGVAGHDEPVEVEAGAQEVIENFGPEEDADYEITVSAEGNTLASADGTYGCVTPTTEPTPTPTPTPTTDVSPDVVEQPAPEPTPAQPAAQAAAQDELPATGLGSTELLLLALLMLGLGTAALLGSDPRRQN